MKMCLLLIKETGSQKDALSNMQTRSELYETISYHDFEELDTGIAKNSIIRRSIDKAAKAMKNTSLAKIKCLM